MKSSLNITLDHQDPQLYQAFSYPGGERQVRLTEEGLALAKSADEVNILARLRSPQDVIDLILLGDAIDGLHQYHTMVNLLLPYMPYSRADRRFTDGDCYGLGSFLNMLSVGSFDRILTFDLHSDNQANVIHNVAPDEVILKVISRFAYLQGVSTVTVLFPDKGAAKRYGDRLPLSIGNNHQQVKLEIGWCEKKRDPVTGNLTGFQVPKIETLAAIVIDDICDGGRTFLGIADALGIHRNHLGLYVSHGIFSQGLEELNKRFQSIYTSNSFKSENDYSPELTVFDCIAPMLKEMNRATGTASNAL